MKNLVQLSLLLLLLTGCMSAPALPIEEPVASEPTDSYIDPATLNLDEYELPEGEFKFTTDGNFYGTFYVLGHVEMNIVPEPFCESDCAEYLYASFEITNVQNEDFQNFLTKNAMDEEGNIQVGLGCVDGGLIYFENHSDQYISKETTLSAELSADILGSTIEEPMMLILTKLPLTGGRGAPACYSHFSTVEEYTIE